MTDLTLTVATLNDDWASAGSNLENVLEHHADIVGIQEGKRATYRTLVPFSRYGVHQDTSSPGLAGSVVVWEHRHLGAGRRGFTFGVRAPGLLARYIAWVCFKPAGVHPFAFLSAHWPPQRVARFWHPYTIAVAARIATLRAAGYLVIVACDSNQHRHPARYAGLRWHSAKPGSIDGYWISPGIHVFNLEELPYGSSDHRPVLARLRIPSK